MGKDQACVEYVIYIRHCRLANLHQIDLSGLEIASLEFPESRGDYLRVWQKHHDLGTYSQYPWQRHRRHQPSLSTHQRQQRGLNRRGEIGISKLKGQNLQLMPV